MNFAQRLKNARENAHILQKELSERIAALKRETPSFSSFMQTAEDKGGLRFKACSINPFSNASTNPISSGGSLPAFAFVF